jgi:hypothetical protein
MVAVAGFPMRRPGLEPRQGYVGFMVEKAAMGKLFSEYFGFYCQSFHRLFYTLYHPIGKILADVPSGLSHTTTRN